MKCKNNNDTKEEDVKKRIRTLNRISAAKYREKIFITIQILETSIRQMDEENKCLCSTYNRLKEKFNLLCVMESCHNNFH